MSFISDLLYTVASCLNCFDSPVLRINRRKFHILRLLGEGGFSYVYLVRDDDGQEYALKKIRCAFGAESVETAMKEIEAYGQFRSPYVIPLVDSTIVQEPDGSKIVYLVLPYYRNGNLQDKVNDNIISGKSFSEPALIRMFLEIARALQVMHKHYTRAGIGRPTTSMTLGLRQGGPDDEDEEEQAALLDGEDTADTALGDVVPYAHRDLKPANIMLDDNGNPVLMDLGSCTRARITVHTRQEALSLQDVAAEHSTMSYRAPELFDVKTGATIDERTDIWSLGATFFALMYGSSPFELSEAESGASLSMAVQSGQFKFPPTPEYSDQTKNIVTQCLTVDPANRPNIDHIISLIEPLADAIEPELSQSSDASFAIGADEYDADPEEF